MKSSFSDYVISLLRSFHFPESELNIVCEHMQLSSRLHLGTLEGLMRHSQTFPQFSIIGLSHRTILLHNKMPQTT